MQLWRTAFSFALRWFDLILQITDFNEITSNIKAFLKSHDMLRNNSVYPKKEVKDWEYKQFYLTLLPIKLE